jgi:hypothetical protein
MRKLFSGPSFAAQGQAADVKEVAIKFEKPGRLRPSRQNGQRHRARIAKVQVTPIAGGTDPNKPLY